MSKDLPLSDHRARRRYLTEEDYGGVGEGLPFVPSGHIARATWKNIMGLPDSVAIETSDEFAPELEWAVRLGWSWLDILDQLPKDSPAHYQVFSALETFQASIFNVLNGWYRIAGICLRCALEDMLLGLYYQYRPADREEYEKVADGSEKSPSLRLTPAEPLRILCSQRMNSLFECLISRFLDPKKKLREFHEYFAGAYEARGKLAARIGISNLTLADVLAGSRQPMAKTIAKLRAFLDAEAKRNAAGNGIKPTTVTCWPTC